MLNLTKPLCFFDIEATGIDIGKDRIVEISILKVFPNGNKESATWLVNPLIPIPEEASRVHGITYEKVQLEPNFKEIAPRIVAMIKDSDLAGYNSNRFDVPLLAEELLRNGFNFDGIKHRLVDVQVIFHKMEPRTLSAAYEYYCGKKLKNHHSSKADTQATYEILQAQINQYNEIQNDINFLSGFTSSQIKNVDLAGFIQYNKNQEEIFTFGKYKGKKVSEVLKKDSGYYGWIQNSDFPFYTKKILTSIKLRDFTK